MASKYWTVKTRSGDEWGHIRRLIIDRRARQILAADVVLSQTKAAVRVPWDSVEIEDEVNLLWSTEQLRCAGASISP